MIRGALLIGIGLLVLVVAPSMQQCVTDGDATVCETTLVIVANVLGGLVMAAGALTVAVAMRHKIAA